MPGGTIGPLREPERSSLVKEVPQLPIEEIDRISSLYRIMRDHTAEPPAKVRDTLRSVAKQAKDLNKALHNLSEESKFALLGKGYDLERLRLLDEADYITRKLSSAAGAAAKQIGPQPKGGKGQNKKWRHWLVYQIAALMESCGLQPNASSNGDLCLVIRSILDANKEEVDYVDKLVAAALK